MTDVICPICGKHNPPEQEECLFCQAPLKSSGFIFPAEGEPEQGINPPNQPAQEDQIFPKLGTTASLEQAIPDWLKETEAGFLKPSESDAAPTEPVEQGPDDVSEQIDALINQPDASASPTGPNLNDDWLSSLLEEAGLNQPPAELESEKTLDEAEGGETDQTPASLEQNPEEVPPSPVQPAEKPAWLSELEASSTITLEGGVPPAEEADQGLAISETSEAGEQEEYTIPDWVGKPSEEGELPPPTDTGDTIAPAELPGWLEALRPTEEVTPTEPVEDISAADVVTAGPLAGLRGVISAHPSAIRAHKPPTYSIKLRVTEEQSARVKMMEELLANEQNPKPLPAKVIISSRHISRLLIAAVLILPMFWMIITGSQKISLPQPGNLPGVLEFSQQVQNLPIGVPVLLAFDYEPGFSGEMGITINTLLSQLVNKKAFLTLVTTSSSGPALAESQIDSITTLQGGAGSYSYYTNLGYVPGGTLGLLGLATSPKTVLPYSLDGSNVWAAAPLNTISAINDFAAVIVLTNDSSIARAWIEQAGPFLQADSTPLLIVTSAQAEPLILPYFLAAPAQVQGLVTGLAGGLAYTQTIENDTLGGLWDAYSIGVTVSVLIILVGGIVSLVLKLRPTGNSKER